MVDPTNPREEALLLFLGAFEAWGMQRNLERSLELAKQAATVAAKIEDEELARRIRLAVSPFRANAPSKARGMVLQGMTAPFASPGPVVRSN